MLACAGFEKRTAASGIFGYNTSKKRENKRRNMEYFFRHVADGEVSFNVAVVKQAMFTFCNTRGLSFSS